MTADLEELLRIMDEESLDELEVSDGPFQVKLVRQSRTPAVTHERAPAGSSAAAKALPAEEPTQGITVKSPLAGIFFRSPSPQAAPFVKEGDTVHIGQKLCIIEAMKVMNEITATAHGKLTRILAENGNPVQAGQPLFQIEPVE